VQVSDLMPLDRSALEAVAILTVVSGGPGEESLDRGDEAAEAGTSTTAASPWPGASSLERYLGDMAETPDEEPGEILATAGEPPDSWPEWAWRPGNSGAADVAGAGAPGHQAPSFDAQPDSTAAPEDDEPGAGPDFSVLPVLKGVGLQSESRGEAESSPIAWAQPLAGALVISSMLFAGRAAWNRRRAGQARADDRPAHVDSSARRTRRPDSSSASRARDHRGQDLPPWLADPSPRQWPTRS
jgi:hypothetical protein